MKKTIVVASLLAAFIAAPAFAAMPVVKTSYSASAQLLARDGAERTDTRSLDRSSNEKLTQESMKVASDGAEHLERWHQQSKKA